jgi:hypothetical protein
MIAAGIVFLLSAIKVLDQQRRIVEVVPFSNQPINIPAKWNDGDVTRLLQQYQDRPAVLSHAVSSIKARLIMGQDLKTAQQRLKLLTSVIEVFKANKELQAILQDIRLAETEFEIRQIETQTRLEDAQARQKSESRLRQPRRLPGGCYEAAPGDKSPETKNFGTLRSDPAFLPPLARSSAATSLAEAPPNTPSSPCSTPQAPTSYIPLSSAPWILPAPMAAAISGPPRLRWMPTATSIWSARPRPPNCRPPPASFSPPVGARHRSGGQARRASQ